GPRLLIRPGLDPNDVGGKLLDALEQDARQSHFSSAHALFIDECARSLCEPRGWLLRRDCQFHWSNRGYGSFEQYLAGVAGEKRKKPLRERRRVAEAGITFETRTGREADAALLDRIYALHRDTFLRHGHEPYLNRAFFGEIARTMGEALMFKVACHGREI